MDLAELKRREKELRKKYGDDFYEKMYTQYKAKEPAAPAAVKTPAIVSAQGAQYSTQAPDYRPNSSAPKSIEDYRKGIEDINKRIDDLNKQQYQHMLIGNDNRVTALDSVIKSAERQRDEMKKQMSAVLGVGSESSDTDMLRAGGGSYYAEHKTGMYSGKTTSINEGPQLDSNNMQQITGLDDGDGDSSAEPSPSPLPGPPPVEEGHPDMEEYEDLVDSYWDKLEDWEAKNADPTKGEHVYITEDEYTSILAEIDQKITDIMSSDRALADVGPMPGVEDLVNRRNMLETNWKWSQNKDRCDSITVETEPPAPGEDNDQGLQIAMNSEKYGELKEDLGGAYYAAMYLADYILEKYGDKIVDDRSRYGLATEIYIHDYLNTLIPEDIDYSKIEDKRMAECLNAWKITARQLNVIYDGDANRQRAEILAFFMNDLQLDVTKEAIMQGAAIAYMMDDYRARYGTGALFETIFD